ncbi:MAG: two-component system response regulator [Syntrophus sp. (in: bacteria)]|nr:two-component system response regulator [Syntrophus sp. (in: bacteria)]
MSHSILLVDDEENVLSSLKRILIDDNVRVVTSSSPLEAIQLVKSQKISVVISDNMMPEMKGIDLLEKIKLISPDTTRIMMTAYADLTTAIDAINRGEVYRFITKPWDNQEFRDITSEAIARYVLISSLRHADETTILSLAQTIELKDPYTRGHCERVAHYALLLSEHLGLSDEKQKLIKYGSYIHDCGKIGVPESVLNCRGKLTDEQMEIVKNHSRWGADLARTANLPDTVISIILYHHERYDGNGYPYGIKGDEIPLEAKIVNIADMFDALTSDRPYRDRLSRGDAIDIILECRETALDPRIVDAFIKIISEAQNG